MIGQAIFSLLNANMDITDVVTGIFPVVATQDAIFPYIVYQEVTTLPTDIKDSASPLDLKRIQIDVYAGTKAVVDSIAANIRTTLDRHSSTISGVVIDSIKFLDEFDGAYEEELTLFRYTQEYEARIKRNLS